MTLPGIAISGWEAISTLGIGAAALDAPSPSPKAGEHPLHALNDQFPQDIAYRPAYFDVASLLGGKGIRTMDRTTALAVCTAKLLHQDQPIADEARAERVGFVVGTSTGSIRSTSDFTRDSLVQDRPFLVNPAHFPNTVMNCAAGQCGIWFKARSVNATISGGRLSGLLSIKYAAQMLRRKYADKLFTGSVEELCPQTAWAHLKLVQRGRRRPVPLGEGCAMFALERTDDVTSRGDRPNAEILALQYGRYFDPLAPGSGDPVDCIVQCIEDALRQCGFQPYQIAACALCGAADAGSSAMEREAVERALGRDVVMHGDDLLHQFGDTYSASFSLGLGRLLSSLARNPIGARAGMALIAGEDGHVGCLIVQA